MYLKEVETWYLYSGVELTKIPWMQGLSLQRRYGVKALKSQGFYFPYWEDMNVQ